MDTVETESRVQVRSNPFLVDQDMRMYDVNVNTVSIEPPHLVALILGFGRKHEASLPVRRILKLCYNFQISTSVISIFTTAIQMVIATTPRALTTVHVMKDIRVTE